MSDIEDRVKKIIVEQLGVSADEVTEGASFVDDLGADSLDTVAVAWIDVSRCAANGNPTR